MLNILPFARRFRPSHTPLLLITPLSEPASPSRFCPAGHIGRLLLFAAGAWLASACTSESSPEQPTASASAPVAEDASAEESSPNDGNDDCRKMQDMWDALPKLETYQQFKRDEMNCVPTSRAITYKFRVAGDDNALMTVALWDEDKDGNENAFLKSARELDNLTNNPNSSVRKSSLGIGDIPTVSGNKISETASGGKFVCLFKGHYYFEILVAVSGNSLANPQAVESFVKEYVKQIDPSKLK